MFLVITFDGKRSSHFISFVRMRENENIVSKTRKHTHDVLGTLFSPLLLATFSGHFDETAAAAAVKRSENVNERETFVREHIVVENARTSGR